MSRKIDYTLYHQLENIIDLDQDSEEEEENTTDKIKGLLSSFY